MNESGEIEHVIMKLLLETTMSTLPKLMLEKELFQKYSQNHVESVISKMLNDFQIDLVIDYPPEDSVLFQGVPVWHLRLIPIDEKEKFLRMTPLQIAILRILQNTTDDEFIGELPIDEIQKKLVEQGITEDIEFFYMDNKIDRVQSTMRDHFTSCLRIVPEYEKTEKYKKTDEEIARQAADREAWKTWIAGVNETLDDIVRILASSPGWSTREHIIKQIPEWQSTYIDEAFDYIDDNDELVETKTNLKGGKLYRIYPDVTDRISGSG